MDELLTKDKVKGTVQPNPFTEKATSGNGFTVMYAFLISASTVPLAFVTTKVTVNVPGVLNACEGLVKLDKAPSPKSQALETMALAPFGVEVLVKFTGTPTQTTSGLAEKLAVGVCACDSKAKKSKHTVKNKRIVVSRLFRSLS